MSLGHQPIGRIRWLKSGQERLIPDSTNIVPYLSVDILGSLQIIFFIICESGEYFQIIEEEYFQKIEIIFKILTLWAAGSATARQSFGLEYFGQASFNLLRQGRLSLDYLDTNVTNFLN